jgi:hypothetical protein
LTAQPVVTADVGCQADAKLALQHVPITRAPSKISSVSATTANAGCPVDAKSETPNPTSKSETPNPITKLESLPISTTKSASKSDAQLVVSTNTGCQLETKSASHVSVVETASTIPTTESINQSTTTTNTEYQTTSVKPGYLQQKPTCEADKVSIILQNLSLEGQFAYMNLHTADQYLFITMPSSYIKYYLSLNTEERASFLRKIERRCSMSTEMTQHDLHKFSSMTCNAKNMYRMLEPENRAFFLAMSIYNQQLFMEMTKQQQDLVIQCCMQKVE